MKVFLDLSGTFAGISTRDAFGYTPFLQRCANYEEGYSKQVFSFLLDRGSNVSEVSAWGESCLHLCLASAGNAESYHRELEALIYLVSMGADVWAKDSLGKSVSHVVYDWASQDRKLGSYRRDLWDVVLAVSGYNVLEVRGNIRRVDWYPVGRGRRKRIYTRARFRQLWVGREHLCPYPEDLGETGLDYAQEGREAEESGSDSDSISWSQEISDVNDSDVDNSDAIDDSDNVNESDNIDHPDVDDPGENNSPYESSNSTYNSDSTSHWRSSRRCSRCDKPRREMGDPQCHRCGWSFGCRDPQCDYCNSSDNSLTTEGEESNNSQEEDDVTSEAPPSDAPAEAQGGALGAESSSLIHEPDHFFG